MTAGGRPANDAVALFLNAADVTRCDPADKRARDARAAAGGTTLDSINRRWMLNGRRTQDARASGNRDFLDYIDVLLSYREQLTAELQDVEGELRELWAGRAISTAVPGPQEALR